MADTSVFSEDKRMLVGNNYHFFNRVDHAAPTDYPDYYGYLLSQATVSVKVWDPFFKDRDEEMFGYVQPGVEVTILYMRETIPHRQPSSLELHVVKPRVEARLPSGHGTLKVACLPSADVALYEERKWHDRFLIIDDSFVFLVGGSLRYQHKSAKCFGIYDISDDEDAALILERFEKTLFEVERKGYVL